MVFHKENKKKLEIVKETDKNYRHVGKHKDISYVCKLYKCSSF